jgi:adenylate cyclase
MPRIDYGGGLTIDAPEGMTVLEASMQHGLDHRAACGAQMRCTTCRVEILEGVDNCPPMKDSEREVLTQAGFRANIRLGCTLAPTGDIKIRLLVREQIHKEDLRPEGMAREQEVAVLFADIRNFTAFSERHLAFDVLHLLNRYFDRMGTIIDFNRGEVIAFLGDGIVCMFDDNDPREAATSSTRCGLQMLKAAHAFSLYASEHFGFDVQIGIGIAWGPAVIGEVGYYRNSRLNCIGDVVNTASRVQDATKEHGAHLLVTAGIRGMVGDRFELGREFTCELRGKAGEHRLHEVVGEKKQRRGKKKPL